MEQQILAWFFPLVMLSFNVTEEFMVERRKGRGSSLAGASFMFDQTIKKSEIQR
jgi:hypothetical protein